jgi:succinate-semialdehyde dehydrogenase / glutarate-semialdehyde dehydrogenase
MNYPNVQLFIDGKWRPAASGKTIPVLNPATEEHLGTVAHAEKADLDEALAAAEKAFKAWRVVSPYERSAKSPSPARPMSARTSQRSPVST